MKILQDIKDVKKQERWVGLVIRCSNCKEHLQLEEHDNVRWESDQGDGLYITKCLVCGNEIIWDA